MRTAEQNRRAAVSRQMAFDVLPARLGSKPGEFAADFEAAPEVLTLRVYAQAAAMCDQKPHPDDLARLRSHWGELRPGRNFYLIEYPTFPAVNLLVPETGYKVNGGLPPGAGSYVLAPYLSAVVVNGESREAVCYNLVQAVDGTTAVRAITADANSDLGPGCGPTPEAFLAWLRQGRHRPIR